MTAQNPPPAWDCEAYGEELPKDLATCFFQEVQHCVSETECHARMVGQRQFAYRRMQELAATGDPVWVEVAEHFPDPSTILNADRDTPPETP